MSLKKGIYAFLLVLAALAPVAAFGIVPHQEEPAMQADGTGPPAPPIPIPPKFL